MRRTSSRWLRQGAGVGSKLCTDCGVTHSTAHFNKRRSSADGLNYICKDCARTKQRKYNRARHSCTPKKATVPSSRRVCRSCRHALDITELGVKCAGCLKAETLKVITRDLPSRLARPGCLTYGSTCRVLDEANERWVEMPVKHCKRCGIDQHLDVCLDCAAPVGARDKQKSIRPLQGCVDCGAWAVNARCPDCLL
jgi:hypothetical protein